MLQDILADTAVEMNVDWDCWFDEDKVESERRLDKMRTTFNTKFDGLLLTRSAKKGYSGRGTLICHSRSQYLKTLDLEEVADKMKEATRMEDSPKIRHCVYLEDHVRITYDSVDLASDENRRITYDSTIYITGYGKMHCAKLNVFKDGKFTFRKFNQSQELELVLSKPVYKSYLEVRRQATNAIAH